MKNMSLLLWLTQLGVSVAMPLIGLIWLGVWLKNRFGWGGWIVAVCAILGIVFAIDGLRYSLRLMDRSAKSETREDNTISFNEHD